MEMFKDCKGYEGSYQVSSYGRVWSVSGQCYVKETQTANGLAKVFLIAKNGKRKAEYIDRLVALAFVPNPEHYAKVCHIDGNNENNINYNLAWVAGDSIA